MSETMQTGRERSEIPKALKEKYQPRILHPEKLSSKSEGEIKDFLCQTKME